VRLDMGAAGRQIPDAEAAPRPTQFSRAYSETLVLARLHLAHFRRHVVDVYRSRCCVCVLAEQHAGVVHPHQVLSRSDAATAGPYLLGACVDPAPPTAHGDSSNIDGARDTDPFTMELRVLPGATGRVAVWAVMVTRVVAVLIGWRSAVNKIGLAPHRVTLPVSRVCPSTSGELAQCRRGRTGFARRSRSTLRAFPYQAGRPIPAPSCHRSRRLCACCLG
jgi:hypothetical protein